MALILELIRIMYGRLARSQALGVRVPHDLLYIS